MLRTVLALSGGDSLEEDGDGGGDQPGISLIEYSDKSQDNNSQV